MQINIAISFSVCIIKFIYVHFNVFGEMFLEVLVRIGCTCLCKRFLFYPSTFHGGHVLFSPALYLMTICVFLLINISEKFLHLFTVCNVELISV